MRVDENGCDWKDIFGWIGVAVVLVALTALSVCTLGAAAPISGIAATMVVGGGNNWRFYWDGSKHYIPRNT